MTSLTLVKQRSIDSFPLTLLNLRQLKLIAPNFNDPDWFSSIYQSRIRKKYPEFYSLGTLVDAVRNSEATFEQFPTDERNVKAIARSIFADKIWMMRDVTLASLDNQLYIVGGRHRVAAIASVFAQIVREHYRAVVWSDTEREEAFRLALEQNVRCDVMYLSSKEDLLTLITADNESRTMRKAEHSHILAQAYGADSHTVESIGKAVLGNELDPKTAVSLAAQWFVRRQGSHLKPQTRQVIGEKVAKHILFGTKANKKLSTKNALRVTSLEEFRVNMDRAWSLLLEVVEGEVAVSQNSTAIAKRVIDRLTNDRTLEQRLADTVQIPLLETQPEDVKPDETIVEEAPAKGRRKAVTAK